MAKSVKSSLTNILVWVLLAMLVFGLAGFGVTSFGGNVRSVATVGKTVVDANAYARALEQQVNALREQAGQDFTFAQAEQMGVPQSILQQRIGLAALEEAARQAELSVGDDEVARRIQQSTAFQGIDGTFDREGYKLLLSRNGLNPEIFEDGVRREAASTMLRGALVTGLNVPATYGETLFTYFTEERSLTYAAVSDDLLDTPPAAPTEEQITAFYDANTALFTIPAQKDITYVWLSPDMLIDDVALSDDDLRAYYTASGERFNRPEQRMVNRLGFADRDAAAEALAAIEAGDTTFEAILAERGLSEDDVDMGAVSQSDLATAAEAAVFALDDTGFAGPVDSAVGPAIFRVNAILSAQVTPYEDALPEMRAELARAEAEALVVDEIEGLDDLLAGGATLEELAEETPMELGSIAWSTDSAPAGVPANLPEFQAAADALAEGDFAEIIAASDGTLFALTLAGSTPERVQPLDEVRDAATAGAAAANRIAALTAKAEDLLAQLESGEDFASLGLEPLQQDGISRQRPAVGLPLPVLPAVYEMAEGDTQVVAGENAVYLMRLDAVSRPQTNSPEAQAALARLTQETNLAMTEEMLSQFASAIATEAGVTIDQTSLNAIHTALR